MFERVLFNVIQEGIDKLVAAPDFLRAVISVPGWEKDEIDSHLALWANEDTRPKVVHGYARIGARLPCYAIVLTGEGEDAAYLGQSLGIEAVSADAQALVASVEKALGRPVKAGVTRWKFDYSVFVYAEHPEVCLAAYNVLRAIFISAHKQLTLEGVETPMFSGADLMPDPRYMPDNLFARQFNISGFGHVLFTRELGLGPWALGRGTKVGHIFVNDHVTGVVAGVNPVDPKDLK